MLLIGMRCVQPCMTAVPVWIHQSLLSGLLVGPSPAASAPACRAQEVLRLRALGVTGSLAVVDTQLCHLLLQAQRAQLGLAEAPELQRTKLTTLMSNYGLQHGNKMDVVMLGKADSMCVQPALA